MNQIISHLRPIQIEQRCIVVLWFESFQCDTLSFLFASHKAGIDRIGCLWKEGKHRDHGVLAEGNEARQEIYLPFFSFIRHLWQSDNSDFSLEHFKGLYVGILVGNIKNWTMIINRMWINSSFDVMMSL